MSGKRLLLVDGYSLANRAFYALPPLSNNEGVPTGAVFGFLAMLFRFLQEKKPSRIVVAFDHQSPTWRHRDFQGYKATRRPSPEEFKAQIPVLKEVLDALRIPRVEMPGYEADDLIGTLARSWEEKGYPVTILSGDKDCLQIVDELVEAILPVKGISQVKEYSPDTVRADVGVSPAQVRDLKALAGDPSDNIPGVKGIGEKTAVSLLRSYEDLEDIYRHLDEVSPPKVRALLESGRENAFLSKKLATIDTSVPLQDRDAVAGWDGPDLDKARALFTKLEFHTLLPRLAQLGPETEEAQAERPSPVETSRPAGVHHPDLGRGDAIVLDTPERLASFADDVRRTGRLAIYAAQREVTGDFLWPDSVGLSCGEGPRLMSLAGDRASNQEILWNCLQPLLVDEHIEKVGFDLKWVFTLCFKRGVSPRGIFFDILVGAYLLDPTRIAYRLDDMARKYAGIEVSDAASGAHACFAVAAGVRADLRAAGLTDLAEQVEFPIIEVLAAMEAAGIRVDLDLGRSIRQGFADVLAKLENDIYNLAGEKFNLGSPKQLAAVLFDKLGLKPVKKTKTGLSTDAEVLEALSLEHELPAKILEYRQYAKLKSTYLDVLEDVVSPTTGRIHSTFHQTVTATGRLSSSEPNLQNIPVRGELGRSLRRIFVPDDGRLFVASDYSQIELRIMAHMSGDPSMIDAFVRGEDIHARTASEIFGVPIDEVSSELRSRAKAVNFGVIYGISDYGLARNTGVSRAEAKSFIERYFARYPKVKEYMEASVERARRDGYVSTILGRRRPIPDINSRIRAKRLFAERTAINTPIQGSAADIIKLAMVRIYRRLKDEGFASRLILQVHDELIFEVPPHEEERICDLVRREMEGAMPLKVPLKVDIGVGKSWYEV